jgi:hypothetical protein
MAVSRMTNSSSAFRELLSLIHGLLNRRLAGLLSKETAVTLGLATALGFGMSTQYLAQLFVWREWPFDEVMEGWRYVLRDRLIVALAIALALRVLGSWNARSLGMRTGLLAASVFLGSASGEWIVQRL